MYKSEDFGELVWEQKMMMDLGIIEPGNPCENADEQLNENASYNRSVESSLNQPYKEIENHMVIGEYYTDNEEGNYF